MIASPSLGQSISIKGAEFILTLIAVAVAFAWPRLGNSWFSAIERTFGKLARQRRLAVAAVGLATFLLRLAILPWRPIPLPFLHDDFSNLLAADTFVHGRVTNPTPPMWIHFENIHITMQPTYMTMYFPAQGLVMAAGRLLFGNPWFGVLVFSALMCSALCWMLQAWLPLRWALLGGVLAMLRLGLFSYWVDTYIGAGLISAFAGALVLGALPRLTKTARFRYGLLMAVGIGILALSRPYEGVLLCLPVAFVLGRWALSGKNRPSPSILIRRAAVPVLLIGAALACLGYYDYRAFGSPFTLPYTVDRATYAMAPYYVWQPPRPAVHYRHEEMRKFYYDQELNTYQRVHSWTGFIPTVFLKLAITFLFFAGFALLPPLIMLRRVFLDRRVRFLVLSVLVLAAGMLIEIYLVPHYLAPFTAAFYAIGLQAMRHLRVWSPEGRPTGLAMVRLIVALCIVLAVLRPFARSLGVDIPESPSAGWANIWYGPDHYGEERARVAAALEQLPGKHLVLVRYPNHTEPMDDWVYNESDIDASKIAWAWDMDAAENLELLRYYKDRSVWLVEPGSQPVPLSQLSAP